MMLSNLDKMTRGWFVGDFSPTLYKTTNCEVAVKHYKKDDFEEKRYHRVATEITVIVMGKVRMFDREFEAGDIIIAEPYDETDFMALEESKLCVVKIPGAKNDKYLSKEEG